MGWQTASHAVWSEHPLGRAKVITGHDDSRAFAGKELLAFGPFLLNSARRVLLRDGEPVRVGARAMEILIALTERPGVTLGKRELLGRVWPDSTTIQESTLRVYISQLRKILRDGETGVEYVQNVTGRGYRFIALTTRRDTPARAVSRSPHSSSGTALSETVQQPTRMNDLPVLLTPVFGRAQAIHMLAARLSKHRFVTITGPGGGGKTTLAVSVAVTLASAYPQGICFVDLASVTEPRLVPGALASALGVAALSHLLPNILSFLSKKSVLLVLDNCEHVIEAAAQLAARVLNGARDVHILATSREPLQAAGESIYRLPPLEVPPAQFQAPRETLLDFPAIRLFTERAGMYSDSKLHDAELLLVANICRQLGGNPLAIEITAAYASLMGVRALAASLRNDHYLSINGLRTAVSRQRTLRATLDWSYDLLSPSQQLTFRRLSVFVGSFDLECAVAVVAEENQTVSEVLECLTDLTRKSLVIADTARQKALYRLPDLPRAFAREKLGLSGELAMINRRHA